MGSRGLFVGVFAKQDSELGRTLGRAFSERSKVFDVTLMGGLLIVVLL
jgi:hypothetical protein